MATASAAQKREVFALLDGVRGVGAIIVAVAHTAIFWGPWAYPASGVCVDIFFLLSGFVIAYAYEPKFAKGMGVREFMLHRLIRLYPLYLFGALLGLGVYLAATINDPDFINVAASELQQTPLQLLMLPTSVVGANDDLYSLNPPAWTLFFEMVVNLAYVLVWPLLARRGLWLLVLVCAFFLAATVFAYGSINTGMVWSTFLGGLARASFGFFAGVLIYRLTRGAAGKSPRSMLSLLLLPVIAIVTYIPASAEHRPYLDLLLLFCVNVPLIVLARRMEPPSFAAPLLASLGRISFALYILHFPLYVAALRANWRFPELSEAAPLTGAAIVIVAIGLAYVVERFYDAPLRSFLMRKAREWQQRRSAPGGLAIAQSSPRQSAAPRR